MILPSTSCHIWPFSGYKCFSWLFSNIFWTVEKGLEIIIINSLKIWDVVIFFCLVYKTNRWLIPIYVVLYLFVRSFFVPKIWHHNINGGVKKRWVVRNKSYLELKGGDFFWNMVYAVCTNHENMFFGMTCAIINEVGWFKR